MQLSGPNVLTLIFIKSSLSQWTTCALRNTVNKKCEQH